MAPKITSTPTATSPGADTSAGSGTSAGAGTPKDASASKGAGTSNEADGLNLATVVGTVSSDPIHKELPSGSVLIGFSVSVRTAATPAATSLPVVWFDPPAKAAPIERGTNVVVVGRLARRFFRAGGQTQSRTELVAERVEPVRRKATCRRLLDAAGADLASFADDTFA